MFRRGEQLVQRRLRKKQEAIATPVPPDQHAIEGQEHRLRIFTSVAISYPKLIRTMFRMITKRAYRPDWGRPWNR